MACKTLGGAISTVAGSVIGFRDLLSVPSSQPYSNGFMLGSIPDKHFFIRVAAKCALLIFNSRASSVGGNVRSAGGLADIFVPLVLLNHIESLHE